MKIPDKLNDMTIEPGGNLPDTPVQIKSVMATLDPVTIGTQCHIGVYSGSENLLTETWIAECFGPIFHENHELVEIQWRKKLANSSEIRETHWVRTLRDQNLFTISLVEQRTDKEITRFEELEMCSPFQVMPGQTYKGKDRFLRKNVQTDRDVNHTVDGPFEIKLMDKTVPCIRVTMTVNPDEGCTESYICSDTGKILLQQVIEAGATEPSMRFVPYYFTECA